MAATIRGILLAAGYSTRFGSNKLLQALPAGAAEAGTPIGVAAARHLLEALPESIAVVRPRAQKLGKMLRDAGCNTVVCRNANEGMGSSRGGGAYLWIQARIAARTLCRPRATLRRARGRFFVAGAGAALAPTVRPRSALARESARDPAGRA